MLVITRLMRWQHLIYITLARSTIRLLIVLLSQLISTRGGENNSSDEKLNKQRVLSTSQPDLFITNPNKLIVAKLRGIRIPILNQNVTLKNEFSYLYISNQDWNYFVRCPTFPSHKNNKNNPSHPKNAHHKCPNNQFSCLKFQMS